MKILATSAIGQLGSDLMKVLDDRHQIISASRANFDITSLERTMDFTKTVEPNVIVNAAAFTGLGPIIVRPVTSGSSAKRPKNSVQDNYLDIVRLAKMVHSRS